MCSLDRGPQDIAMHMIVDLDGRHPLLRRIVDYGPACSAVSVFFIQGIRIGGIWMYSPARKNRGPGS